MTVCAAAIDVSCEGGVTWRLYGSRDAPKGDAVLDGWGRRRGAQPSTKLSISYGFSFGALFGASSGYALVMRCFS